jgi:hypothetical protein
MIKEAKAQKLDYTTYIAPLRSQALELVHQAHDAQPQVVEKINADLLALEAP